jgi:hypothetical protein
VPRADHTQTCCLLLGADLVADRARDRVFAGTSDGSRQAQTPVPTQEFAIPTTPNHRITASQEVPVPGIAGIIPPLRIVEKTERELVPAIVDVIKNRAIPAARVARREEKQVTREFDDSGTSRRKTQIDNLLVTWELDIECKIDPTDDLFVGPRLAKRLPLGVWRPRRDVKASDFTVRGKRKKGGDGHEQQSELQDGDRAGRRYAGGIDHQGCSRKVSSGPFAECEALSGIRKGNAMGAAARGVLARSRLRHATR